MAAYGPALVQVRVDDAGQALCYDCYENKPTAKSVDAGAPLSPLPSSRSLDYFEDGCKLPGFAYGSAYGSASDEEDEVAYI